MENINQDEVAHVIITHFLSSLMQIERERLGYTRKAASKEAGMPASTWGELERGARVLGRRNWMEVAEMLNLGPEEIVRRLNAFIGKYPSIWLERVPKNSFKVCDRPITSPRALRSGNVTNVDLNLMRPSLYYDLASFSKEPEKIVEQATELGFFLARKTVSTSHGDSFVPIVGSGREARQAKVKKIVDEMSDEKLGLLERVVDKFQRYSARELAVAYQHFSLSVSKN